MRLFNFLLILFSFISILWPSRFCCSHYNIDVHNHNSKVECNCPCKNCVDETGYCLECGHWGPIERTSYVDHQPTYANYMLEQVKNLCL
jgi:hypothetical protein